MLMSRAGPPPALLLIGHGTRSEQGARQFLDVTAGIEKLRPDIRVQPAFLELCEPDIPSAVKQLGARGATSFVSVPLLLFAAGHAKDDIPQAINRALDRLPGKRLPWVQAEHLGCDPLIVGTSEQRFNEAIAGRPTVPDSDTCLLLVGRGSSDESAVAEMHDLAQLRAERFTGREIRVAFVARAEPRLQGELDRIAAAGFRRVIVQPHLLFEGEVVASIRDRVAGIRARWAEQDWVMTDVLADPPGVSGNGSFVLSHLALVRYSQVAIRIVAGRSDD
jgi:sirohydrochlorin cobaltochelatase